jgi:predicted nucleic acid-binding protein
VISSNDTPAVAIHHDRVPHANLTWILPDVPAFYHPALEIMRASSGELNFNDALIALACREREISAIASFDSDFDRIDWLQRIAAPDDLPNGWSRIAHRQCF